MDIAVLLCGYLHIVATTSYSIPEAIGQGRVRMQKEKRERVNLYQEITDRIIHEMEQGVDSWQKTWGSTMPRNLSSKRDYSGINTFLLWLEQRDNGYATGDWLSFRQAKAMGGTVKKGEKGTRIVFFKRLEKEIQNEHGETELKQTLMAKYSHVFNISQIDGCYVPASPRSSIATYLR